MLVAAVTSGTAKLCCWVPLLSTNSAPTGSGGSVEPQVHSIPSAIALLDEGGPHKAIVAVYPRWRCIAGYHHLLNLNALRRSGVEGQRDLAADQCPCEYGMGCQPLGTAWAGSA